MKNAFRDHLSISSESTSKTVQASTLAILEQEAVVFKATRMAVCACIRLSALTMRFNGAGIEYESSSHKTHQVSGWNCDLASAPFYNACTLSTGAEVSLWIWQQYLITGDREFLRENFPVMAKSAQTGTAAR
jgi:hypothetical protein